MKKKRRIKMMAMMKLKMDNKRGRLTFPDNFLKANKIKKGSHIEVFPVYNREDSVRLQFEWEEE